MAKKKKRKVLPSFTWHHPHNSMYYGSHKYWSLKSATHNSTLGEEGINKLWADGASRRGGMDKGQKQSQQAKT